MIEDAVEALRDLSEPQIRPALWKIFGLTLLVLVVAWAGLDRLVSDMIVVPWPWIGTALSFFAGVGLLMGLGFLLAPVSALFAGFYLDDLADFVERRIHGRTGSGKPVPPVLSVWLSVKFSLVSIAVNVLALLLLLVPGINIVAFGLANAFLLGREYFELAAMRYRSPDAARAFRRDHAGRIFLAGLVLALFVAIPFINLLTPMFATAYMVRIHARLSRQALRTPG